MRYLKLASAKNPDTDFIELNDLNGYLCTSFQSLGISRKLEFLAIKNRQFVVDNKTNFKRYNLTIEILSKYRDYENKYRYLINFLDRNKKDGFRLYYRPYEGMDLRYCLCDIENSSKVEKMRPVSLVLVQESLWLGELERKTTTQKEIEGNLFAYDKDEDIDGYFASTFGLDASVGSSYYCVAFNKNIETEASITNDSYNEIPLNIILKGPCVNPTVSLFRTTDNELIRQLQVLGTINEGYYVEINSNILNNGVWYVNEETKEKIAYDDVINYEYGSPYFYIEHGDYFVKVVDEGNNVCEMDVFWQEEFSD